MKPVRLLRRGLDADEDSVRQQHDGTNDGRRMAEDSSEFPFASVRKMDAPKELSRRRNLPLFADDHRLQDADPA